MRTCFLYIFICFVYLFVVTSSSASGVEVSDNYINTLTAKYSSVTIDDVKNNSHGYSFDLVVARLREMDNEYLAGHSQVLIRLRDLDTINTYLDLFVEYRGAHRRVNFALSGSRAPWLVPELIDLIGEDPLTSQTHPNPEEAVYYGLSGASLRIVHAIVSKSEDLPFAVREWAAGINIRGEPAMNEAKRLYLDWWELNEAAFMSEEYDRVIPLSEQDTSGIDDSSTSSLALDLTSLGPDAQLAIDEGALVRDEDASEEPQEVLIVDPEQKDDANSLEWVLLLTGIVVVITGFAFKGAVSRKKRR